MEEKKKVLLEKELSDGRTIEAVYAEGTPGKTKEEMLEMMERGERAHFFNFCPKLNQRTYEAEPGILCEQDVAVTLRDNDGGLTAIG